MLLDKYLEKIANVFKPISKDRFVTFDEQEVQFEREKRERIDKAVIERLSKVSAKVNSQSNEDDEIIKDYKIEEAILRNEQRYAFIKAANVRIWRFINKNKINFEKYSTNESHANLQGTTKMITEFDTIKQHSLTSGIESLLTENKKIIMLSKILTYFLFVAIAVTIAGIILLGS